MKYVIGLLLLASTAAAQEPLHAGDHVRFVRGARDDRYRWTSGVVQAVSADSSIVLFRNSCRDSELRSVPHSELAVRAAGGRLTIPYAIGGAVNAFFYGKIAGHVIVHNGGGPEGARAARYGFALLIPFFAMRGYEHRLPRWVPISEQTPGTQHLHVVRGDDYLTRQCDTRGRP